MRAGKERKGKENAWRDMLPQIQRRSHRVLNVLNYHYKALREHSEEISN